MVVALRSEASGRRKTIITGIPAFVFFGGTNFDVWKFELESLLGRDQPGFQTHANVCWCSETQWSTDETFRISKLFSSGFLWLRGKLRSNLAVEQCLSHLTRVVSPKSTARPRMLTMRRHDPKVLHTSDTSFRQPTSGNTSVESTERLPNKPSAGSTKCTES